MNLLDLPGLSKENDGYKFIVSVNDMLSKYVWLVPLKSKHGKELKNALQTLFEKMKRRPQRVQRNKGIKFLNSHVQSLFKHLHKKFFTSFSEHLECSL